MFSGHALRIAVLLILVDSAFAHADLRPQGKRARSDQRGIVARSRRVWPGDIGSLPFVLSPVTRPDGAIHEFVGSCGASLRISASNEAPAAAAAAAEKEEEEEEAIGWPRPPPPLPWFVAVATLAVEAP